MNFLEEVDKEYIKARKQHPEFHSFHEGYAVLLEEVDELWDEIKKKQPNKDNLIKELIQIATMAKAFYEELVLKETILSFDSLGSYYTNGKKTFTVQSPATCKDFDWLIGQKVEIDGNFYKVWAVESFLVPLKKIGEKIGIVVEPWNT